MSVDGPKRGPCGHHELILKTPRKLPQAQQLNYPALSRARRAYILVPSTMERRARARAFMVRTDCAKFPSAIPIAAVFHLFSTSRIASHYHRCNCRQTSYYLTKLLRCAYNQRLVPLATTLTLADCVMSALNPTIRGDYAVLLARSSSSAGYIGSPAMLQGGWWVDRYAATLSILQNRFCESSIRSLNTAYLMAQFNVGYITPDSSSEALVYLTTLDAIEVYWLGYALLSYYIPCNDAYVDEHALGAQMVMLADWAAEKWIRKNLHAYEEAFMKDLWKPASVEWMAMILRATHLT